MKLKLYKKLAKGWVSLDISSLRKAESDYDHQPTLISQNGYLHLAWVRGGQVWVARSESGETWSEPLLLSGTGARSTCFLTGEEERLSLAWVEREGDNLQLHLGLSDNDGVSWAHLPASPSFAGSRLLFDWGRTRGAKSYLTYHYGSRQDDCDEVEFAIVDNGWKRLQLNDLPDGVCGRSLDPTALVKENALYVLWQERKGRISSIAMNYAKFPWTDWLPVSREILRGKGQDVVAAPKLVSLNGRVFLVYFVSRGSRAPLQKRVQRGDLILQEMEKMQSAEE
jgi:hypothetical protein